MPKGSGSAPARGRRGRGHAALTPPDGAEAEGGSDSSDGGDGGDASGSESGEECEAAVTLESLLAPLSLDEFCRDYWGQKPYATRVERGVLDQLRARFLEGEFGDVAAACRNDDNARCGVRRARAAARRTPHAARRTPHAARHTPHAARRTLHAARPPPSSAGSPCVRRYTAEEIADLQAQVEGSRRTVCLPFCFAPGAIDIKRSFIDRMGSRGYGNDIEVRSERGRDAACACVRWRACVSAPALAVSSARAICRWAYISVASAVSPHTGTWTPTTTSPSRFPHHMRACARAHT